MRKYCFTNFLLLNSIIFFGQLSVPAFNKLNTAPTGNTYAVIVGIANYENQNIPNLNFCNRDAQAFSDYLRSQAGGSVPSDNIRLLIDTNATTAAVYNALNWLHDKCDEDMQEDSKTVNTIYFFYSGHGDVESQTINELGFLLTYNTPANNYINNAVRLEDLNYYAITLSVQFHAKVILVTDACHAGKLAGSDLHGPELVGRTLNAVQQNEIRLAACLPNELSNENQAWGGGRGVFSYYLINGLKGLADKNHDNIITLDEARDYVDSCIANDGVLKQNSLKQTPVLNGRNDFKLANVNKAELLLMQSAPAPALKVTEQPDKEYFFGSLKSRTVLESLDLNSLSVLSKEDIPAALIGQVEKIYGDSTSKIKFARYQQTISKDKAAMQAFIESLVEILHSAGQTIINLYLQGDAAELEKRSYYNSLSNNYDKYAAAYDIAIKLTPPEIPLSRILQVNKNYFTGLVVRLKIPATEESKQKKLVDSAWALQQKALHLEPAAAYIQNELGILSEYRDLRDSARKYFMKAVELAPTWAIPHANLSQLNALGKKFNEGIAEAKTADSLQPGLQTTSISLGYNYEMQGDQLRAEEQYRKAIDINSRHYSPFERLGYVYMNTTQYAQADSFFFEAGIRKAGYHFNGSRFYEVMVMAPIAPLSETVCYYDSSKLKNDDIIGLFYWAMDAYYTKQYATADRVFRRIITLDSTNPLAFHYLGKVYYDQQRWEPAEIFFKFALRYQLSGEVFSHYADSLSAIAAKKKYPYDHSCMESFFRAKYYFPIQDNYFLASIDEKWGHLEDAELNYHSIIRLSPDDIGGYIKLWQLLESSARYAEAEKIILEFASHQPESAALELNAFYRRAMLYYPYDWNWPLKLGNFLYEKAFGKNAGDYIDTIIYFPLQNKEVFIDINKHNALASDPQFMLDMNTDKNISFETQLGIYNPTEGGIELPGTLEQVKLALAPIYTTRKDAIFYLSKAAQLISDTSTLADIHFKIGNVFLRAGSPKQSFPYYDSSIQYNTRNANARMKMIDVSRILYRNSTSLKHLDYLNDSLQISFPYSILLGEFSIHEGKFDKAKKILLQVQSMYPYKVPATYDLLGRLNLMSHQPAQAIPFYKTFLGYHLKEAETDYTLAKLNAQAGNEEESWKWLNAAVQKGFNYSYVLISDPVWNGYRNKDQWKKLMASVKMKTYFNPLSLGL